MTDPGQPWVNNSGIVGLGGTGDDHVDRRAADRRAVLRPGVEAGLGRAPVVGVAPSATECLERRHVGAVVPADVRELVGPAGVPQAQAQIVQELVRDGDRCRLKPVGHRMVGRWALDRRITDPLVGRWCAIAAFGSSHRFLGLAAVAMMAPVAARKLPSEPLGGSPDLPCERHDFGPAMLPSVVLP